MPRVPAHIMWWCGHATVRQGFLPVGLALKFRAMARGAPLGIEPGAECKLSRTALALESFETEPRKGGSTDDYQERSPSQNLAHVTTCRGDT